MHPHPLPIVRRTWSCMHITHSEVTMPFPLGLHSEQIKRHWLSQLPFWRVHPPRSQCIRWALGRCPITSLSRQFWPPQADVLAHMHWPQGPYIFLGLTYCCPILSCPEQPRQGFSEKYLLRFGSWSPFCIHCLPFPSSSPHLND